VFHLVDPSTVIVELNIIETKKRFVSVGTAVEVTVDALPGTPRPGTVTVVNPLVDPASRKFLVKVSIPNQDFALEPGMFARVSMPEQTRAGALAVPARAVTDRNGRRLAFVDEGGCAREREVATGLVTPEQIEILSGLSEGEAVIVDGLLTVKDGTRITAGK